MVDTARQPSKTSNSRGPCGPAPEPAHALCESTGRGSEAVRYERVRSRRRGPIRVVAYSAHTSTVTPCAATSSEEQQLAARRPSSTRRLLPGNHRHHGIAHLEAHDFVGGGTFHLSPNAVRAGGGKIHQHRKRYECSQRVTRGSNGRASGCQLGLRLVQRSLLVLVFNRHSNSDRAVSVEPIDEKRRSDCELSGRCCDRCSRRWHHAEDVRPTATEDVQLPFLSGLS